MKKDLHKPGRVRLMGCSMALLVGHLTAAFPHDGTPAPVRVDTQGVSAMVKYEAPVAGPLTEVNGKYKLRVTEITIAPGGHVGDHNHLGPGIRQVAAGQMHYILPDKTVIYGPGDYFFEAGDVSHRVENRSDSPSVHLLFEILPRDVGGPSLIPPQ
jgi:quercetin dioxygenase-like cupin family protein